MGDGISEEGDSSNAATSIAPSLVTANECTEEQKLPSKQEHSIQKEEDNDILEHEAKGIAIENDSAKSNTGSISNEQNYDSKDASNLVHVVTVATKEIILPESSKQVEQEAQPNKSNVLKRKREGSSANTDVLQHDSIHQQTQPHTNINITHKHDEYAAMLLGSLSSTNDKTCAHKPRKKHPPQQFEPKSSKETGLATSTGRPPLAPPTNTFRKAPPTLPTASSRVASTPSPKHPAKQSHTASNETALHSLTSAYPSSTSTSSSTPMQDPMDPKTPSPIMKETPPGKDDETPRDGYGIHHHLQPQSDQSNTSLSQSKIKNTNSNLSPTGGTRPSVPSGSRSLMPQKQQQTQYHHHYPNSQHLTYSWDSLKLGTECGSAALNNFFQQKLNDSSNNVKGDFDGESKEIHIPRLTAQDTLQIIHSLKVNTTLPPKGSILHRIIQKSRLDNRKDMVEHDESNSSSGSSSPKTQPSSKSTTSSKNSGSTDLPFPGLAEVYETMCAQDTDDDTLSRREAYYFSPQECLEKFRSLENTVSFLRVNERDVLKRGKALGLLPIDPIKKAYYKGYRIGKEDVNMLRLPPPVKRSTFMTE